MAAVLHGHVGEPVSQASLCAAAQQQHEHAGAAAGTGVQQRTTAMGWPKRMCTVAA
jgi:hypothetical protein